MKIYYPTGDRTPDFLSQRQTCYHLSQRGELVILIVMEGDLWLSLTSNFFSLIHRQQFVEFWLVVPCSAFPFSISTPVVPWLSYSPRDPRFAGSNPTGVDGFLQSVKILSMTSFEREVKPWIPCHRFTACKRTSSQN